MRQQIWVISEEGDSGRYIVAAATSSKGAQERLHQYILDCYRHEDHSELMEQKVGEYEPIDQRFTLPAHADDAASGLTFEIEVTWLEV